MAFVGFVDKDFETYQPARRTSATHTLARRQVREKLKALVGEALPSVPGLAGMELVLSAESPSLENNHSVADQGAFWVRPDAERQAVRELVEKLSLRSSVALDVAVFHKHAALGVVVDESGLSTLVAYHPRGAVDRQNLKALLLQGWAQDAYLALLQGLPEDFRVLLPGMPEPVAPSALRVDAVMAAAKALDGDEPLRVWRPRDRAAAQSLGLVADVAADLAALVPVYRFGAWSRDADHIQAVKAVKEQRQEAQRASSLQVGDKVKILAGLWSGRTGTVEAVDKKGGVKVQVGLVSVKLDSKDAQVLG